MWGGSGFGPAHLRGARELAVHLRQDRVNFGLLGRDALAQLGVRSASGCGLDTVALTLGFCSSAGCQLVDGDRLADEPEQPGERVALLGRLDVGPHAGTVAVDVFEDLVCGPAALDEAMPGDRVAYLADVAAADPHGVVAAVRCSHVDALRLRAGGAQEPGQPVDELRGELLDREWPTRLGLSRFNHSCHSWSARSAGLSRASGALW